MFHPDMLIWIDETGSDRRNSIQKYGYSLRGTPAQVFQLRVGGKCISAIPDPTTRGIEDVYKQSMVRDLRSFCVSVWYPSSCHTMVGIDAQL